MIIGFSTRYNNLISWAIRKWDKTPYSHCYMRDGNMVYDSTSLGFTKRHLVDFLESQNIVREYTIPITDLQEEVVYQLFKKYKGRNYGFKTLLGIVIAKIFRLKKNPLRDGDESLICSESAAYILKTVGYKFDKGLELVTPKEIEEAIICQTLKIFNKEANHG